MKVLQIANDYLGTPLYASLFNALKDVGVTSVVFVPVRTNVKYRKEKKVSKENNDFSILISPCFNTFDRLLFFSKQKKMFKAIHKTVDLSNICCTHAHTLFSAGYTAMKLKETFYIPYIVAVRNSDVNIFFKKMKHLHGIGVEIMKNAEKIIFLSPAYKRYILTKYVPDNLRDKIEKKAIVIPNGISDIFLQSTPGISVVKKKSVKIIYAGDINKNKNLTETVNACKILIEKGYICRFEIVGDVKEKECSKILNESFVTYYPRCGHDELIRHYRNNDIFVMPSHTETFGLVYAEAMSQGLPVIYTRGQGFDGHFPEGEVGYSVSDHDPVELANKIEAIVDDYEAISKRCIENAAKFDWNIIADLYKCLYEETRGNK